MRAVLLKYQFDNSRYGGGYGTYSNVVNPDHVAVINGDGITTPDVLRVDVGDSNVSEDCKSLQCLLVEWFGNPH